MFELYPAIDLLELMLLLVSNIVEMRANQLVKPWTCFEPV
jgi:hypothetical protein